MAGKAPLAYLKQELGFTLGEWQKLDAETQAWYRNAAIEEMNVLGVEVSVGASK